MHKKERDRHNGRPPQEARLAFGRNRRRRRRFALAERPSIGLCVSPSDAKEGKSRNALMDAAYDDQVYVDDRTIDSHVKRLRRKFKASDNEFDMIETLYGVGYRLKEL